jgi:hypothetical protein
MKLIVGHDPISGNNNALVANGNILTRKVHKKLPGNIIPFDFKVNKAYVNPTLNKQSLELEAKEDISNITMLNDKVQD